MTNVVLVTVDSLRADHVNCLGYDRETTPVLNDLATDGAVCENVFSHACSTRPSFPSILTSSYPLMYGGFKTLSSERTLVSTVFRNAGYRTGGFHSNAYLNPEFGYSRGFQTFYDSMDEPGLAARFRQYVKRNMDKDGTIYQILAKAFATTERNIGASIGSAYVDAREITDVVINWVRKSNPETDDFLWVHYMDVHHPYLPPAEHQLAFRDEPLSDRQSIQLRRAFLEDPTSITEEELGDIIDLYDAEIRATDEQIGRLHSVLEAVWDDYILLVTADHGEEFREHGRFSHHATFYDEVVHVPLIISGDLRSGRYDELVGLIDVAPTLVDIAGLSVPENFHGDSLQKLLEDGDWERDSVVGDWASEPNSGNRRLMYRDKESKYIRHPDGQEELYDLTKDPEEKVNIVSEEPDRIEAIRSTVDSHDAKIDETKVDVETVEMEPEVEQRLRDLGYQE